MGEYLFLRSFRILLPFHSRRYWNGSKDFRVILYVNFADVTLLVLRLLIYHRFKLLLHYETLMSVIAYFHFISEFIFLFIQIFIFSFSLSVILICFFDFHSSCKNGSKIRPRQKMEIKFFRKNFEFSENQWKWS